MVFSLCFMGGIIIIGFINVLGIRIYNYALFIIVFCLITKIFRTVLSKINKKQSQEKAKRDKKIKELQKMSGGNQKILADKIFEYYQESNYNPFLSVFTKIIIIIIDFAIILAMVATFKPITNFNIVSDKSAESIVSVYTENEKNANRYTEIRLLRDLEKYEDEYKKVGVSEQEMAALYNLRNTFKIGTLDTYIVPTMTEFSYNILIPLLAFVMFLINILISLIKNVKNAIKLYKTSDLADKISLIIAPIMSVFSLILVSTFIFNTPIIISFYFIINYTWNLVVNTIDAVKKKK